MKNPLKAKKEVPAADDVGVAAEDTSKPEAEVKYSKPEPREEKTTLSPSGELRKFGEMPSERQRQHQGRIDAAFQAFLGEDPSREQFVEVMGGVLLTPGMLYTALEAHH